MSIKLDHKIILITGGAGFIGYHLTKQLLDLFNGIKVVAFDNLNDYYDVDLKKYRLNLLKKYDDFIFIKGDLSDELMVNRIFEEYCPDMVVNLGGQAGVRYSITNPRAYIDSNINGFFNILEACRKSQNSSDKKVKHLIYASSSSVYGTNKKVPYSIEDKVDNPVSLYAATKKSNELMAYSYSKLYGIPSTGLRFFTVYGPMGRPDMAYFSFTDKLIKKQKIQLYNNGDMYRDFTYVDDIVSGVMNVMGRTPTLNEDKVSYKIYNIGNNHPESLLYFVETLEQCLISEKLINKPGEKEFLPMQPGDVYQTYADVDDLMRDFGFKPSTNLKDGLMKFVQWYKEYYHISQL